MIHTEKKPTTLRDSALIYNSWGLSTIPLAHGSKEPVKGQEWKKYQYERMSKNVINLTWNGQANEPNLGIVGGLVSNNNAALDFDSSKLLNEMMHDSVMKEIRSNTLVSLSANKHLPHIHVKFPYPIVTKKIMEGKETLLDVKANGQYVAAPNSCLIVKNQLLLYSFENFKKPLVLNNEQADYLVKRLDLKQVPESKYYFYGLNYNGYKYVTTGDYTLIGKHDRSNADQKILFILMMQGKTKEEIKEFIHANYYKESKFFEYRNEPDYYFEHSYNSCLEYIKDKKIETNSLVQAYQKKIYSIPNNSDQKVFQYLLNMSTWQGTTENFFASMRDISLKTGVSLYTASKSVKRLLGVKSSYKVIALEKKGTTHFQATSFKEPLASTYKILPIPENLKDSDIFDSTNMNHDLFRTKKGLGAKGKIVFDIIKGLEGCSLSEVLKEASTKGVKSRNTVKSKIRSMITFELIRMDKNKFYVNPMADFDNAAKHLGTLGTLERQNRDYDRQRIAFRSNRF
jgi:hypothetical protein